MIIPPPTPIPESPFTPQDLTNLNGHLAAIETGFKHLNLARQAGFDVTEHHKALTENRDKLLKIKNVYFPGQ